MGSDTPATDLAARSTDPLDAEAPATAYLEHLTGPLCGTVSWIRGSTLDVLLRANRRIELGETRTGERDEDLVARLHRSGEGYEIESVDGLIVWVNGSSVATQKLRPHDIIEFGASGPLSRFSTIDDGGKVRLSAGRILNDAADYLRVSRRPVVSRWFRMTGQVASRLCSQTTILFRFGMLAAIVILGALAYQQTRVNALLEERVATSAGRLDQFSAALARARRDALTPGDLQGLRSELAGRLDTAAQRLERLEKRSSAAERVITASSPSVLFLQGAYGFRHKESGRMLRQVVDADGRPLISPLGQPMLTLDGAGPVAERQFTGSAFVVGDPPRIVTNRHVAKPWESDTAGAEMLAAQGLDAVLIKFIAYAPGEPTPRPVEVTRVSEEADLAVLRYPGALPGGPALRLRASPPKPGDEVFVLGYPTGLRTMLVQAGDAFIAALQKEQDTNFWSVAARLAKSGFIAPLASRGIVGQVTTATIVYDAETTQGGSGGPVLDANGEVIAVNTAILPEFGGSNLGVPAARVEALLRAGPGQ